MEILLIKIMFNLLRQVVNNLGLSPVVVYLLLPDLFRQVGLL